MNEVVFLQKSQSYMNSILKRESEERLNEAASVKEGGGQRKVQVEQQQRSSSSSGGMGIDESFLENKILSSVRSALFWFWLLLGKARHQNPLKRHKQLTRAVLI